MGDEGPFPNEGGDAPAAASVSRRGPGGRLMPNAIGGRPIRTVDGGEPDYVDELDGLPEFPGCRPGVDPEGDERRRLGRLTAKPMERPALEGQAREAAIRGCLEACESHAAIYGGASLFVEALAGLLNVPVSEAEALVLEERARRK